MTGAAVQGRSRLAQGQAVNLSLLVIGYAGYYLCRSNLSVAVPLITAELAGKGIDPNTARVMLGSAASLGVLAYAVGKFPSGSLADLFGGRRNFLFGMGGSIVFTLLFAASGSLPLFTVAWMGNRLVQSLGWAGAVRICSRWFDFRHYGAVMAILSLSYLFGDAAARQFMGLLIAHGYGWRAVFVITAAVLGVVLVACIRLRESPAQIDAPEPAENPANLFRGAAGCPQSLRQLLPFLSSGVFWLACALSLGTTILRETFGLWTPTYLIQSAGMSAGEAAGASALFPFFGGISVLLCGWLSDRLGPSGRAALLVICLALAAAALLLLGARAPGDSRGGPMLLVAVAGFLIVGPYSFLAGAISLDFGGKAAAGTASGIIDGVGYLGGVLAGDSMARISVHYGWSGAFAVLAGASLISSATAAVFLRHENSQNGPR